MDIPPLSSSFLSASFINPEMIQGNEEEVMVDMSKTFGSLSIKIVEVEDQDEKALECFFRSLEFVTAMYMGEGLKVLVPKLSDTTHAGIK